MTIPERPKDAIYINGEWICRCGTSPVWRTSTAEGSRGKRFLRCPNVGGNQCRLFIWEDNEFPARSLVGSEFGIQSPFPLTPQTPGGRFLAPDSSNVPPSTRTPMSMAAASTPTPYRSYQMSGGMVPPMPTPHQSHSQQRQAQQQDIRTAILRGNSSSQATPSKGSKGGHSRTRMSTSTASVSHRSSSDTFGPFGNEDDENNDDEDGGADSPLFGKILDLLRDADVSLKGSTRILLRDLVDGETDVYEMRLQRSENTILRLRRRLNELERERADSEETV